ncbi:MAG: peptide-methionine (S)-S-oxide reductase MsrA [Armatimonadetes bacterium]|nr:peptide-methionine (S)-S-oxide reductase MsrA [Armatimonadota bacterium]
MSEVLVFGAGCFWCVDAMFRDLLGVESVESGYAGGHVPNPTYEQVCSKDTGHAEVVKITFDPSLVSREDLLRIFFTVHDPTTLNRQGGDIGPQYRSVIFYDNEGELALARQIMEEVGQEGVWPDPIVTTLEPLGDTYFPAETYHQDYYNTFDKASFGQKMTMNMGYCQAVVAPKVLKFRKQFSDRLRKSAEV